MTRSFYSNRHYRAVSPPADTAADIAERVRRLRVLEQVRQEREARYPVVTGDNFKSLSDWQERRIAELLAEPEVRNAVG